MSLIVTLMTFMTRCIVSPSTSFKMSAAKKSDGYGWMLPVTRGLIAASIAFGLILQIKIFLY